MFFVNKLWLPKLYIVAAVIFSFNSAKAIDDPELKYIKNNGQWNTAVKYKTDFNRGAVFLEKKGFTKKAQYFARFNSWL